MWGDVEGEGRRSRHGPLQGLCLLRDKGSVKGDMFVCRGGGLGVGGYVRRLCHVLCKVCVGE